MQMLLNFAVLFTIFALALAAPSPPQWPQSFSASVISTSSQQPPRFFRWFYSLSTKQERYDTVAFYQGQQLFVSVYVNHTQNKEWSVIYNGDTVNCFSAADNHTMVPPNFSNFSFAGNSLVDYQPCYHWFYQNAQQQFSVQFFDQQSDREPVRIDFADQSRNFAETWIFSEFDSSPQDPNLFVISPVIFSLCN